MILVFFENLLFKCEIAKLGSKAGNFLSGKREGGGERETQRKKREKEKERYTEKER